ncbi:unnamed protein product [Pieris brassicae]|uniref:ATP synthase F(0) complex subunit e, mitochondrial n=1 Tax=Pieris brassicae TaxID=7116 RepID=A0A9P0TUT7_PIEBR|nr:unnamed protein product [Pieris brassicae]
MSLPYGPPVQVSPSIRAARYALLAVGIIYGFSKQMLYSKMEAQWREEEAERQKKRDIENAKLKAKIAAEERETVRLMESGELFKPGRL